MMKKSTWIILGIVAIVVIWGISGYNRFVTLNTAVDNQWAQVETQYQRRFDLIPNLVNSVKGVLAQEQKIFGDIADARTRYAGATTVNEKVAAANEVESTLGRLLVIMENYPQLRSSETVQTLMAQLEGTENRISVERSRFNDAVGTFNVRVKRFPSSILASIFGFDARNYFQAAQGAETAPTVNLE
jgi:LemA protein